VRDALAEGFGKAIGISANKNDFAGAAIALFAEPAGQSFGALRFATGIEEEYGGGAVGVETLNYGTSVVDLVDFDGSSVADALHVIIEDRTKFWAAGFAEHEQAEAHEEVQSLKLKVESEKAVQEKTSLKTGHYKNELLQTVLFALFEQRFPADAENFGGFCDVVAGGFQGLGNGFALEVFERTQAC
jgi:hypothetical protein